MADLKISEMTTASQVNNDDNIELSQGNSQSGFATVKASILAIAQKIAKGINFTSDLQTTNKTIIGAINEAAQGGGGGASDLDDLSDVSITNPSNGQVLKYNSTSQEWENANESGGGAGHTILDDSGNDLAQEDDLQFAGTYSADDSTNGRTVVNITREMTTSAYNQLSNAQKKGVIVLTDDDFVCEIDDILYGEDGQGGFLSLGDYLDDLIADNLTTNDSTKALSAKQGKVLNEKIDEISEMTSSMEFVNISDYTVASGNLYSCPTDGYFVVVGTTQTTAQGRIYAKTDNVNFVWFNTNTGTAIYVKKGSRLCGENFNVLRFVKLV